VETTSAITRHEPTSAESESESVLSRDTTSAITEREAGDVAETEEAETTSAITKREPTESAVDSDFQVSNIETSDTETSETVEDSTGLPQAFVSSLPEDREIPDLERAVKSLEKLVEQYQLNGLVTYHGWHPETESVVTVYALSPGIATPETRDAFEHAASDWYDRHTHNNVIRLQDGGSEPQPWLAAKRFEDTQTLTEFAGSPAEEILAVVADVAAAIDSVDSTDYQHGNLTPEHVLVFEGDDGVEARVGGWGILPAIRAAQGKSHITPYMAPEQLSNDGHTSAATDVYGLGAIAYYGLTGEPPLAANTDEILAGSSTPPSEIASLPPALDAPIMQALSRNPEDRFNSVTEFVRALESALSS
jgi:hypothetical protein